jgi:hypothetical protein
MKARRFLICVLLLSLLAIPRLEAMPHASPAPMPGNQPGGEAQAQRPAGEERALLQGLRAAQPCLERTGQAGGVQFTFAITADMRLYSGPGTYDTPQFFRGACEAINSLGGTAFMVSPGDIDPPAGVEWTIEQYLGQDYLWYPVVGNHESETAEDMEWLRAYDYDANGETPPNIVNVGPAGCEETNYSFDYENSHFVVLNEYCDGTNDIGADGDVVDALYDWLVTDLAATEQSHVFVFGHEPAYPQPDADVGRLRHEGDSLNAHPVNRDRFWNLLRDEAVVAYICGHTHNYSAVQVDGVWQLDAGHARGLGDTGAPSTFILVYVHDESVRFEAYRDDASGGTYALVHSGYLTGASHAYFPLVIRSSLKQE